jgi:UDP-glucuronate decarboxylase
LQSNILSEDFSKLVKLDLPFAKFAKNLVDFLMLLSKTISDISVIALCRNEIHAREKFKEYFDKSNFKLVISDLSEPLTLEGPIDFVIHAASQASPKFYGSDPIGTMMPNVIGSMHLLNLCVEKKTEQMLFFSTSEIYGNQPLEQIPTKETDLGLVDTTKLRSCYAESKRMGENMCIAWGEAHNLDTRIIRIFHTYGPGMKLDDGRVFSDFVKNILAGENISLQSDGSAIRPFCYIKDFLSGLLHVVLKGNRGEAYNVGNQEQAVSILELAQRLAIHFKDRNVGFRKDPTNPSEDYLQSTVSINCPDTTKLKSLGWSPNIGIEEGFARTVAHFEQVAVEL